jgi:tetratricopeptide (TPR) repeat protein
MKSLSTQKINQLQRMVSAAQQARQSGLIAQAESLYRDVLKQAPDAWDIRQQLAILFATTGRPEEAARQFRLIVQANPTHAASHANLATALSESNQLDEAIKEFRRALTLNPNMLGAKIAYAETLRRAKQFDEAATAFREVLNQDKVNHAAFNGLGLVYRDTDDFPRALECLEHAVGLAPSNPEYRINFGATLRRSKLIEFAVEQFYEAVKLKPNWLDAVVLLAEALQEQHRFDEAKECFERAQQIKPGEPELSERIGYLYLEMGDSKLATQLFNEIINTHPDRYSARLGLGKAHMLSGHSKEAANIFEGLIRDYPEHTAAYASLANSRKFSPEDAALIEKLHKLADTASEDAPSSIPLSFALGKISDDCKDWDSAWRYYERGNRLRNKSYNYLPEVQEAKFDALISLFTQEFIEEHQHLGTQDSLPVFIVGMPRSGTTLTEQIISSHPQVIGAGEVDFWYRADQNIPHTLKTQTPYPECMRLMQAEHAQQIADRYSALLRKIADPGTDPARITDKMPHNFVQLGLIALLFPKAPIIHCKRDAMDNCLSIFFQNFAGEHPYAYDLNNLGHHYRQYERLMAHWHNVLPGRILDIQYEETIADPEYWSRKLIEHVGLDWDDACLAPHKLERTVKTASHWQVRQPIYKTSVARWKHYEAYLGPLKEALKLPK